MSFSKKKVTGFIAGMLSLALIAGTWAYFSSTSTIKNEMNTLKYGSKTIEEFTPEGNMEPGAKIDKKVGVTNTGDYDLVVRIKLDEVWSRSGTAFKTIGATGNIDTVAYATTPIDPTYTAIQDNATDGLTVADMNSVVYKKLNATGGTAQWTKGTDGYFYFKTKLTPNQTTTNLMDFVALATNTDIGRYETTVYYSTANKQTINDKITAGTITDGDYGWVTAKPTPDSSITFVKSENKLMASYMGYASADYTLNITTEVCQATKEAVDATWTMLPADAAIKAGWSLT